MSKYNLATLSHQDFEELSRDLLQAEWGVAIEAFTTGRDGGIDLRYASVATGKTIVQCKHYAGSGYSKLLYNLREIERPKIEKLLPNRYVVITSVGLTPDNKDEIYDTLRPFVVDLTDIVGANDIEGLLSRHPEVERANFKLWLTSTSVIERVLHNAEMCRTEFQVDRIRQKLPLFVQSGAFPRAMQILIESRIVVISGAPGIGKTTLADILLYAHLEQGYEPILIQSEISEGRKFFKNSRKQVFYYDDFLGQTFLRDRSDYLGRNQDSALVEFMDMVRRSEHARFILTTREHILRAALQVSERFAHSQIIEHKCVIELGDYTFGDKARILYNHLYFSDLDRAYKNAVLQDDFFLSIIKHEHFNPRLIEWLSTQTRLRNVRPEVYQAHISDLLQSPENIWNHAFQSQISDAARCVILSNYALGEPVEIADLERAFIALHRHTAKKYQQKTSATDFRNALQELDGAFLRYNAGTASYLNPSVRDFVEHVISNNREIVEDILASAVRFKQLVKLWQLSVAQPDSELRSLLISNQDFLCAAASRLLHEPSFRWRKVQDGSSRGSIIDIREEMRIDFLWEAANKLQSLPLAALAGELANSIIEASWPNTIEFAQTIYVLGDMDKTDWIVERGGTEIYRNMLNNLLSGLQFARASEWLDMLEFPKKAMDWSDADECALEEALKQYCKEGVSSERMGCSTLDEMTELRDSLDQLSKRYGFNFQYDISRLDEEIAEREEDNDRREGSGLGAGDRARTSSHNVTDEDVRQLFATLSERGDEAK